MKNFSILLIALLLAGRVFAPAPALAQGQDPAAARAAAIAAQQEAEERHKQMSSDIQNLVVSQANLEKRLANLQKEIRALQEENAKLQQAASVRYASQEDLQKLFKAIQELDAKREEDKKLILREVERLAKAAISQPVAPVTPPRPSTTKQEPKSETPEVTEPPYKGEYFEHTVQKGEYLSVIINAYNDKLREQGSKEKITLDSVQKANPKLNANRMVVGQKIILPDPRKK